jgi:SnoaL-like domain
MILLGCPRRGVISARQVCLTRKHTPVEVAVTLDEVQARVEILDLFARYQAMVDSELADRGLERLFTVDGRMESLAGAAQGTDGLRECFASSNRQEQFNEVREARHFFGIPRIDISGERARAQCLMVLVLPQDGGMSLPRMFSYDDDLARQGEEWLFASRTVRPVN